jgi:hypothetical protein
MQARSLTMKHSLMLIAAATLALLALPATASASDRHTVVRVTHYEHSPYSVVRYRHEPVINVYISPRIRYEPFGVYRVIPRVDYPYYGDRYCGDRYDRRHHWRHERRHERRDDWRDERRHENRRDWDDRSRRNHYK